VCQKTNCKDEVKVSEGAVHVSLNTQKKTIKVSTTHTNQKKSTNIFDT